MSLRKRISASREDRARARAKRREQRRRAERAKRDARAAKGSRGATAAGSDKPRARAEKQRARADKPRARSEKAGTQAETPRARSERTGRRTAKSGAPARRGRKRGVGARPGQRRRPFASGAPASARIRGATAGGVKAGIELWKLIREMIAIPVGLWLAAAEVAGDLTLRAWRGAVRPVLVRLWRLTRSAVRFVDRQVTPARALVVVALVALGSLVAAQWVDYHSVTVGTDAYAGGVGAIAPAPEVETDVAGSAHAWIMLPLAAIGLIALGAAIAGRRRAAALLIPVGIAVIAVALIVDVPKGLDEGTAAIAYEGAKAALLEGFWLQLAAAVVMIACGLMLPRYLRPQTAAERSARPTGPSLIDRLVRSGRGLARRRPSIRLPRPRAGSPRPKRKVQGAGT